MHIYCDFDGTISVHDATDVVLSRLADREWQDIERLWQEGRIGSAECMQRQISLIRATLQELDEILDGIAIDPSFSPFADFCRTHGVPVSIVSDGVDYFIRRILARYDLDHLPIIANRLVVSFQGARTSYRLFSPHRDHRCVTTAGVCKCSSLIQHGERIYVGDGRSDFCVSDKPELVFAKGLLAEHCSERNVPFFAYRDFSDIISILQDAVPHFQNKAANTSRHVAA
ncbi:MtnX-like HAD-IB family phosphatase [Mesorhizobium sp. IMUNJ 23033]|uniref:MtnX-like HAD-IB family phosphatase n=1 Tax=Mesorhizobium sp. IMUNJ 23033 TaxID=3378039 RepID=UPI00384DF22B